MAICAETGHLEEDNLTFNHLSGTIQDCIFSQVEMKILDQSDLNAQTEMRIVDEDDDNYLNTQVAMRIVDPSDDLFLNTQVDLKILDESNINAQVDMATRLLQPLLSQVDLQLFTDSNTNSQVKIGKIAHWLHPVHLEFAHLTESHLAPIMCAFVPSQVEMRIIDEDDDFKLNAQTEMRIVDVSDDLFLNAQVEMRIANHLEVLNTQVNMLKSVSLNAQATLVIYNTTQMRLLCSFTSRGTEVLGGTNWTSVQAIASGDFSPNNLNTDIVEQRTQTDGINALWQLRCDTGNPNTFVDTIGILEHNFTRSALVQVSGSDDPAFSTIKFSFNMVTELENMYYIAPTLPNIPARYYQFSIQDPSNTDTDGLKVGTIVFGSAVILTRKEQFINPVTFGRRHFKDTLQTEGFTSVSNDRALRKFLNLTFIELIRDGGNFRALSDYILTAKTDLKCLIIPRPSVPSALAVFSKMSQLPEELHKAIDDDNWRIDLTFDWDESL